MITRVTISILFAGLAFSGFGQVSDVSPLHFHSAYEKAVLSNAPNEGTLKLLLAADASVDGHEAGADLLVYESHLDFYRKQQLKYRSEEQFLKFLFYRVHRKQLKAYEQYVSLANQFRTGSYDCLTATTLYYLYLTDLGFEVNLVETEYHIYLKVASSEGIYLFESTDPISGFISSPEEVKKKETEYLVPAKQTVSGISSNNRNARGNGVVNSGLSREQLIGLNYYNRAIAAWNSKDVLSAIELIDKSYFFYPSGRIADIRHYFKKEVELLAIK